MSLSNQPIPNQYPDSTRQRCTMQLQPQSSSLRSSSGSTKLGLAASTIYRRLSLGVYSIRHFVYGLKHKEINFHPGQTIFCWQWCHPFCMAGLSKDPPEIISLRFGLYTQGNHPRQEVLDHSAHAFSIDTDTTTGVLFEHLFHVHRDQHQQESKCDVTSALWPFSQTHQRTLQEQGHITLDHRIDWRIDHVRKELDRHPASRLSSG